MLRRLRFAAAALAAAAGMILTPAFAQDPTPVPIVPVARVISPIPDQQVRGATLIQGTAVAPGFLRYEVSYAVSAQDPVWVTIGAAQQPVANGTLATWNTRALADGEYILRLQVFTTDGDLFATVTGLKLTNAAAAASASTDAASAARVAAPTEVDRARDLLTTLTTTLARLPTAFLRGVRIAAIALGALVAYAVGKSLLLAVLRRAFRRRIDYGT